MVVLNHIVWVRTVVGARWRTCLLDITQVGSCPRGLEYDWWTGKSDGYSISWVWLCRPRSEMMNWLEPTGPRWRSVGRFLILYLCKKARKGISCNEMAQEARPELKGLQHPVHSYAEKTKHITYDRQVLMRMKTSAGGEPLLICDL